MLKIKDSVDLKELERFGFEEMPFKYFKKLDKMGWTYIVVHKDTRELYFRDYNKMNIFYDVEEDLIQDLIQAGLLEKVEEGE